MGRMGRMRRMVMGQWDEGTNLWGTMGQWDSTPLSCGAAPHPALSPCTLLPAPFLDTLYMFGKITSYHSRTHENAT